MDKESGPILISFRALGIILIRIWAIRLFELKPWKHFGHSIYEFDQLIKYGQFWSDVFEFESSITLMRRICWSECFASDKYASWIWWFLIRTNGKYPSLIINPLICWCPPPHSDQVAAVATAMGSVESGWQWAGCRGLSSWTMLISAKRCLIFDLWCFRDVATSVWLDFFDSSNCMRL